MKMSPEQFQSIIESAVSDKKQNAKDAVKFLAPARSDPTSSISIGGDGAQSVVITPAAISEAPLRSPSPKTKKSRMFIR